MKLLKRGRARLLTGISLPLACVLAGLPGAIGAAAADQPANRSPNVLFIAIDDLNDWIGCLKGHPQVRTPNIDRIAERGVLFTNAHCAAPLCCPSRAAVFSGRQPFHTGVYDNDGNIRKQRPDLTLLPQHFRANGYVAFGTGKLLHRNAPELFDEHYFAEQRWSPFTRASVAYRRDELGEKATKPRHVIDPAPGGGRVVLPFNRMPSDRNPTGAAGESFDWGPVDATDADMGDGKITDWAEKRLRRQHDRPFFLAVGYYRPHIPLFAPCEYFTAYPHQSVALPTVLANDLDDLSDAGKRWALEAVTAGSHATVVKHDQWPAAVAAYLACVSFVDAQIGRLLDALDDGPHAENTIIVLWSDHGWHLGEKQHWGKWTGWERATRVPLMIAAEKGAANRRAAAACKAPVSLIDLYPTLIAMCSLPALPDLDGVSLTPLLSRPEARTDRMVISTFGQGNYAGRTPKWRLIHYADGTEELYNHDDDPHEFVNLISDDQHTRVVDRLRAELFRVVASATAADR